MKRLLPVFTVMLGIASASIAQGSVKNVVLVHGAFADGSGWKEISDILQRDGYSVYVVQEPETSLDADVAAARLVLDRAGPCVLVGHSYGGAIITQAGVHDAVKSLVYVAAFELAPGESAAAIEDRFPPLGGEKHRTVRQRICDHRSRQISSGLRPRCALEACGVPGSFAGSLFTRIVPGQGHRRGLVAEAELRGGREG